MLAFLTMVGLTVFIYGVSAVISRTIDSISYDQALISVTIGVLAAVVTAGWL